MRIRAVFILVVAGCGSGPASTSIAIPEHLREIVRVVPSVADRHPYGDVATAKAGQWVRYREGGRTFTLAAVGREGDAAWIEVIEEGELRQASARLVTPDGTVKKAYYCEISVDGPSKTVMQSLEQAPPRRARPPEGARETGEENVKVGDRELAAKRVRIRSEDLEGRLSEEVTLWHSDVPSLYRGTADGGLVRRASGASLLQLEAFGADARPVVTYPTCRDAGGHPSIAARDEARNTDQRYAARNSRRNPRGRPAS